MNKQDAMKRIEAIEAEAAALRKIVQEGEAPTGLWTPKIHQEYWAFLDGQPAQFRWYYSPSDNRLRSEGNIFPTSEAAEKAAPLFARAHKIIQAALMADPDAGFNVGEGYSVYRGVNGKWWAFSDAGLTRMQIVHVHTEAQADHMAAILNAEGV